MTLRARIDAALSSGDASEIVGLFLFLFIPPKDEERATISDEESAAMAYLAHRLYPDAVGSAVGSPLNVAALAAAVMRGSTGGSAGSWIPAKAAADAREVLHAALEVGSRVPWRAQAARLPHYAVLLRRAYRQLAIDTAHRKCTQCPRVGLEDEIRFALAPWVRDMMQLLGDAILPQLVQRDCQPQQVHMKADIADPGLPDSAKDDERVIDTATCACMLLGPMNDPHCALGPLLDMLEDAAASTPSASQWLCASLAAALHAACFGSQPLSPRALVSAEGRNPCTADLASVNTVAACLARCGMPWDGTQLDRGVVMDAETADALQARVLRIMTAPSPSKRLSTILQLMRRLKACADDADQTVAGGSLLDTSKTLGGPNQEYLFEEWEGGGVSHSGRAVALQQEREALRSSLAIWSLHTGVEANTPSVTRRSGASAKDAACLRSSDTLALATCGCLNVLVTGLAAGAAPGALPGKTCDLFVSLSPTALFTDVFDKYIVALSSPSAVAALGCLAQLHSFANAIPKYSLSLPGEDGLVCSGGGSTYHLPITSDCSPVLDGAPAQTARTRHYADFFDLAKRLVTMSALCPIDALRSLSRSLTLGLLQLLEERTRVRMELSLMVLSPFPSVARYLLDNLVMQWREARERANAAAGTKAAGIGSTDTGCMSTSVFSDEFPARLVDALRSFVRHIRFGDVQFIDPLIAGLNVFRTFVAGAAASRSHCTVLDAKEQIVPKAAPSSWRGAVHNGWPEAFAALKGNVLPQCEQLLSSGSMTSDSPSSNAQLAARVPTADFISVARLSPLDEFSLRSAVTGLKSVL